MKKQRITALCLALLIFFTGLAGCAGGKAKDTAALAPALTDDKTPDTAAPDRQTPASREEEKKAGESEQAAAAEKAVPSAGASGAAGSSTAASPPADSGETEQTAPPPDAGITCTVSITCAAAYDAGYTGYGTILTGTTVTLEAGDSVYDALMAAANAGGVAVSASGGMYGVYIFGIGGLYEKDCGKTSGWKYTVNGAYPSVSCSGYPLSGGEEICFVYVL